MIHCVKTTLMLFSYFYRCVSLLSVSVPLFWLIIVTVSSSSLHNSVDFHFVFLYTFVFFFLNFVRIPFFELSLSLSWIPRANVYWRPSLNICWHWQGLSGSSMEPLQILERRNLIESGSNRGSQQLFEWYRWNTILHTVRVISQL